MIGRHTQCPDGTLSVEFIWIASLPLAMTAVQLAPLALTVEKSLC
jgi:hypothetical protein